MLENAPLAKRKQNRIFCFNCMFILLSHNTHFKLEYNFQVVQRALMYRDILLYTNIQYPNINNKISNIKYPIISNMKIRYLI